MKQAITRLTVLVVLLINQTLMIFGWSPLPFSEEQIFEAVSSAALVVVAVWTWWKNNNVTKPAQEAQVYLEGMKRSERK